MQSTKRMKFGALASGALLLVIGGSCTQPRMNCTTAHGAFAATYELKTGDPTSTCGSLKGDLIGMQTYFAPGGLNGTPKFKEPSAALRPAYAGDALLEAQTWGSDRGADPVPGVDYGDLHSPNSVGDFEDGFPDAEDFCHVDTLAASVVTLPELPAYPEDLGDPDDPEDDLPAVDAKPARTIRHEWSNAKWLTNPDAQGTQFEADLKLTENGCTAEYSVRGVYPAIPCATDEECQTPGVGINPGFDVRCDLNVYGGHCVLASPIPSYIE